MRALSGLLERLKRGDVSHAGMLACLSVIWLGLVATQLSPCFDMNPDSAIYIELARSIAQGRGYTLEGLFCRGYPPGFSLMLSAVTSPERRDYRPEKLIVALGALGAMLGGYWLLSQRYEGRALVVLAVLVAVSPSFLRYCVKLRSDIPFMFFALVFLAAGNRYWRAERLTWPMAVISAVAMALGVLTRIAGVVFFPVAFVWLLRPSLWRRDARRCIVFAAAVLLIACPVLVGWLAWPGADGQPGTSSYSDYIRSRALGNESPVSLGGLGRLVSMESKTMPRQVRNGAWAVFRVGGRTGAAVWAVVLVPVGLLGLIRRLRKPSFTDYSFCGYSAMVLLWPSSQGARLWVPVLPLMLGYLADGIDGLGRLSEEFPRPGRWGWFRRIDRLGGRCRGRLAWWSATTLLAVGVVSGIGTVPASWRMCREAIGGVYLTGSPLAVARFAADQGERPVVIAFSRFREVAVALSGQPPKVAPLPSSWGGDMQAFLRDLRQHGATHLAVKRRTRGWSELDRRLDAIAEDLAVREGGKYLVHETKRIRIFELPAPGDE